MNADPGATEPRAVRVAIVALSTLVVLAVAVALELWPKGAPPENPLLLPTVNASLNGAASLCLLLGYACIRKKNVAAHRACMLTAFAASSLFLVTYLMHHAQVGSVPFRGQGLVRAIYLSILIPHILLAAGIVPLALLTLYRGYTGRVASHRRIARYTLPIWLYVSISGVVVYGMLYHLPVRATESAASGILQRVSSPHRPPASSTISAIGSAIARNTSPTPAATSR